MPHSYSGCSSEAAALCADMINFSLVCSNGADQWVWNPLPVLFALLHWGMWRRGREATALFDMLSLAYQPIAQCSTVQNVGYSYGQPVTESGLEQKGNSQYEISKGRIWNSLSRASLRELCWTRSKHQAN
jgi:hypothetical protein